MNRQRIIPSEGGPFDEVRPSGCQFNKKLGLQPERHSRRRHERLAILTLLGSLAFGLTAAWPTGRDVSADEIKVMHDMGPAQGPGRQSNLKYLGELRARRSEEIAGSCWGVSCHWIVDKHELTTEQRVEQLAKLGAKWGFLVPDWDRIETEKGKYDFNSLGHRLDDAVDGMVKRKIRPIIQIYGGNRLYMPAAADPNRRQLANAAKLLDDPDVRQAWHRFLEAMVRRYQAHVNVWEIWNEPNGPWFWQGTATVNQYGRMVKNVAEIIKRVDPEATILAGSTAMIPMDFFQGLLESEGADSFDFCAVHPYGSVPEHADGAVRQLQKLLASRGKSNVLWQSECGFPSNADTGGWGYGGPWNEVKHAKWVLRRLLCDASLEMKVSIYFVLNDYPSIFEAGPRRGQMATNRKGLHYAGSWEPKHAAYAFRNLASLIDDRLEPIDAIGNAGPNKPTQAAFKIVEAGSFGDARPETIRSYALAEKTTGATVLVYWLAVPMQTESAAGRIRISLPGDAILQPVLVDLLDGRVYAVNAVEREGQTVFEGLPVADSPVVLCSRRLVEMMP